MFQIVRDAEYFPPDQSAAGPDLGLEAKVRYGDWEREQRDRGVRLE